jgi:hypothetical protein
VRAISNEARMLLAPTVALESCKCQRSALATWNVPTSENWRLSSSAMACASSSSMPKRLLSARLLLWQSPLPDHGKLIQDFLILAYLYN